MTNHVHPLLTPLHENSLGGVMKALSQRYVQYVNRTCQRTGTLWEGRFRSCLMQEDTYLPAGCRHIELNPVRAGMAGHPADYRWSSYRGNAQGEIEQALGRRTARGKPGRPVKRTEAPSESLLE